MQQYTVSFQYQPAAYILVEILEDGACNSCTISITRSTLIMRDHRMPMRRIWVAVHPAYHGMNQFTGLRPCLGPRHVAYERETRKNPAERLATNARPPAAHNVKRGKKNYASQNRKSGLRAAYAYKRSAILYHRPKQGLRKKMMIQYLYYLVWV